MKLSTEIINGIKIWIAESDYLNVIAQGDSMQEALDNFDKTLYMSVRLSKRSGIENCGNFKELREAFA